jgi:uncharacterized protein
VPFSSPVRRLRGPSALTLATALFAVSAGACRTKPPDDADYLSRITAIRTQKDEALMRSNDPIPENRKAAFLPLSYFPIDPVYSVPAQLETGASEGAGNPSGQSQVVMLPTSTGTAEQARRVGEFEFVLDGRTMKLTVFSSGETGLFVPFRDLTTGKETYGAGRYLNVEVSPSGVYDLDFNKAYNPYCYYNPMYTCPLPPPENRLDVQVRAGETIRQEAGH